MANNVAAIRKRLNITQEELAGVIQKSRPTLSAKEKGLIPFTQVEMNDIHKEFIKHSPKITIEQIFFTDLIGEMLI